MVITQMTQIHSPPEIGPSGSPNWPLWIQEYFELKDEAGTAVALKKASNGWLMPKNKKVGTEEFFLTGRLKPGAKYTLTYKTGEGDRRRVWQRELTVPEKEQPYKKLTLTEVVN